MCVCVYVLSPPDFSPGLFFRFAEDAGATVRARGGFAKRKTSLSLSVEVTRKIPPLGENKKDSFQEGQD